MWLSKLLSRFLFLFVQQANKAVNGGLAFLFFVLYFFVLKMINYPDDDLCVKN